MNVHDLPYETKLEVQYTINRWEWHEALGPKPEGWERMSHKEKSKIIRPIRHSILMDVGEKATLRYLHKRQFGATDQQFNDWWDSRREIERMLEGTRKDIGNFLGILSLVASTLCLLLLIMQLVLLR